MKKIILIVLLISPLVLFSSEPLTIDTGYGVLKIGSRNDTAAHLETDRPYFHFNKPIGVHGFIGSVYTEDLKLTTGSNTRILVDKDTGNVGIGTDNDSDLSSRFYVRAETDYPLVRLENQKSGGEARLLFRARGSAGSSYFHANISAINTTNNFDEGYLGFKVPGDATVGGGYDMVINHNGNVGIGSVNPRHKLHISGNASHATMKIDSREGDARLILTTLNSFDWSIGSDRSDSGKFKISQSEGFDKENYFVIDGDTGNIGIGTTEPTSKLDVNGRIFLFGANESSGMNSGEIVFGVDKLKPTWHIDEWNGKDTFRVFRRPTLGSPGEQFFTINNQGNIGVGTTNPLSKLHVAGDGYAMFGPNTTHNGALYIGGDTRVTSEHPTIFSTNGNLHIDSRNGNHSVHINRYSEANTLMNSQGGNVGIGTITPERKLHVVGNENAAVAVFENKVPENNGEIYVKSNVGSLVMGASGSEYNYDRFKDSAYLYSRDTSKFHIKSSGSLNFSTGGREVEHERMRIDTVGNVGIGTTTPENKFHVYGEKADSLVLFENNNSTQFAQVEIESDTGILTMGSIGADFDRKSWRNTNYISSSGKEKFSIKSSSSINFFTGGLESINEIMTINSIGNVGIGNLTPDEKLVVNGTIKATKVSVVDTIAAADIKITSSDEWADYVFEDGYNLRSLEEVDAFIQSNGHLPEMPTADEVSRDGYELAKVNALLLKKIEELTLYTIELNKKIEALEGIK